MPTDKHSMDLLRRVVAEALGAAFLLAAVVGSGIMAERLAGGNSAIALLANTLATTPGFILAQLLGAAAATALFRWLIPTLPNRADSVVLSHAEIESGKD